MGLSALIVAGPVHAERTPLWTACADAGVDVTLVCGTFRTAYDPAATPDPPRGVRTIVLQRITPFPSRNHIWWLYRGLRDVVRDVSPDVIHVHSEPWGLLVLQALSLSNGRRPLTSNVFAHGADNVYVHGGGPERIVRAGILRRVLPRLAGFASWNEEGIRLAREAGLPPSTPTEVVPVGVMDPGLFAPRTEDEIREIRRSLGLPDDRVVVAFFGRLVPEKGIGDLLDVFAGPAAPDAFLAVWGVGPLRDVVAGVLDGRRGAYFGKLSASAVPAALSACDIVAIPSRSTPEWREQFGRIAVEAMLSGCAVVANHSGDLPAVVGDAGVLVEEGDVSGLRAALERLLGDPELRRRLGEEARARALERFTPQVLAERLIHLWKAGLASATR